MELSNSYTCSDFVQEENEHFQSSKINCPANNKNYVVVETNKKDLKHELPVHLQDYSINYDKSKFGEASIEKSLYTRTMKKAANKYSDLNEHCKMLTQQIKLEDGEQMKQIELLINKMRKNEDIQLKTIRDFKNQLTEIKMKCDVKNKEIIQYKDQLSIEKQKCDFTENKYNAIKEKNRKLKNELNELKEKLDNNNKELMQTEELFNREKQTYNLLELKYNKTKEKTRNLIAYVKQMEILKDEICAEFKKQEAEYIQKICERDITNTELKLKLDKNLLTKSKAKHKLNLENYKQNLLLEKYNHLKEVNERLNLQIHQMESKYAKQLEVLKIRFQIETTVKEAIHNDYTSLMGIKMMEFDKLETKFRHTEQKLENLLKSEKRKKTCLEEKYKILQQTNRDILQKLKETEIENEKLISLLKHKCDSEINKKENNEDEIIFQLKNRLKQIKDKLDIYQANLITKSLITIV